MEIYAGALNDLEDYENKKYIEKKKHLDEILSLYKKTLYAEKLRWLESADNPNRIALSDWLVRLDGIRSDTIGNILESMNFNASDTTKLLKESYGKGKG